MPHSTKYSTLLLCLLSLSSVYVNVCLAVEDSDDGRDSGGEGRRPSGNAIRACGDLLYEHVASVCGSEYWKRGGNRHPHSFPQMDQTTEDHLMTGNDFSPEALDDFNYNYASQEDSPSFQVPSSLPVTSDQRQSSYNRFPMRHHTSLLKSNHPGHEIAYNMNPSAYLSMSRLIPSFKPHPEVVAFHRHVRGIVDECCHKPCSTQQLKLYCGKRKRRSQEAV